MITIHILWMDKQRPVEDERLVAPSLTQVGRRRGSSQETSPFLLCGLPSSVVLPGKSPAALGYLPVTVTRGLPRRDGTVHPIAHMPAAKGPLTGTAKTAHVD